MKCLDMWNEIVLKNKGYNIAVEMWGITAMLSKAKHLRKL